MLKRIFTGVLTCVLVLGFAACAKPGGELSPADVQELLQRFSDSPLGLTVRADESAIETDALRGESGHFIVRLNHPEVTFNTGFLRELNEGVPLIEIPVAAEELVLIYGPDDGYLALRSAAGLTMTFDESLFEQMAETGEAEETPPLGNITYRIGRIESNDYDMSLLLETEERGIPETLAGLLGANPSIRTTMTDCQMEVLVKEGEGRVTVTLDETRGLVSVHPGFMDLFLSSGEADAIISGLFEQKDPFVNVEYETNGVRLSLSTPEDDVQFQLDGIAIAYSAEPTADGSTFRFGFNWDIRGMSSEGLKEMDTAALTQVQRLNVGFSVDGLPSGFLEAYMRLIKAVQSFGGERDPAQLEGLQTEAMGLAENVMQAKPIISLKISPLDHAYGRLEADASFQVVGMRPPVGKATVTFSDVHSLAESLERDQILTAERLGAFVDWLEKLFQIDDSGKGTLTFEIKEEDLSHFYLNGKAQKFE